jgi:hypothetical protein
MNSRINKQTNLLTLSIEKHEALFHKFHISQFFGIIQDG